MRPLTEDFGGEARRFLINLGALKAIEEACGPIGLVANRLARCVAIRRQNPEANILEMALAGLGDFKIEDVRAPIYEGLLGAGMSDGEATKLRRKYIDERGFMGLIDYTDLALKLIIVGFEQPEHDPVGEPEAGKSETPRKKSSSRKSTV